jgi:hypothetical protein
MVAIGSTILTEAFVVPPVVERGTVGVTAPVVGVVACGSVVAVGGGGGIAERVEGTFAGFSSRSVPVKVAKSVWE